MEPAHCIAVRYCESTMRRSNSRARGWDAAPRSMAAPERQKADQCFSAAAKVVEGSAGVWPVGRNPQQNANWSAAEVSTKRCADSCWIAAGEPGQAILTA